MLARSARPGTSRPDARSVARAPLEAVGPTGEASGGSALRLSQTRGGIPAGRPCGATRRRARLAARRAPAPRPPVARPSSRRMKPACPGSSISNADPSGCPVRRPRSFGFGSEIRAGPTEIFANSPRQPVKCAIPALLLVWSVGELFTREESIAPGQAAVLGPAGPPSLPVFGPPGGALGSDSGPPRNEAKSPEPGQTCCGQAYARVRPGPRRSEPCDLPKCGTWADETGRFPRPDAPPPSARTGKYGHFGRGPNRLTPPRTWPISAPCPTTKHPRRARAPRSAPAVRSCVRSSRSSRWCSASACKRCRPGPSAPPCPMPRRSRASRSVRTPSASISQPMPTVALRSPGSRSPVTRATAARPGRPATRPRRSR